MAFTVLVVDDSETIRSVLERALLMTKIPIDTILQAANGMEALTLLEEHWVDIVLSDIHMPIMNGLQLVDKMQNSAELKNIPIVIVSTEGSSTRIHDLQEKGIKGYLRKPFTPERIRDTILTVLGKWE